VVDDEQAVCRAVDRNVTDEVIVVAELLGLRVGGVVRRIELGRISGDGVTPTDQYVGVVAVRNVVLLI
jgi:hypothetical protein